MAFYHYKQHRDVYVYVCWASCHSPLQEKEMAQKLEDAIATVIKEEKVKTYDMGGTNTSLEVSEEVIRKF